MSNGFLRDLVDQVTTKSTGPKPPHLRYVGLEHISKGDRLLRSSASASFSDGTNGVFAPGDVLFGKLRPNLRKSVRVETSGFCSTDLLVLRAVEGADERFVAHVVSSEVVFNQAERNSFGTKMPRTSWNAIGRTPVFIPTLEEQRRIAEILDAVDSAVRLRDSAAAKRRNLIQGLAEATFGSVRAGWREEFLHEVGRFQSGRPFPSTDYSDRGVPLLRPVNIGSQHFVDWKRLTTRLPLHWLNDAHKFVVRPGELVINLTAQSLDDGFLGRVAIVPNGEPVSLLNQRIGRLSPGVVGPRFMYWALRTMSVRNQIERRAQGTKVQHLYDKDLANLTVVVPTERSDCDAISSHFWELVDASEQEAFELDKLRRVRTGLAADLLSGRVRTVAP